MSSNKQLASWYDQLGNQLESGIPLPEALLLSEGPPLKGRQALHDALLAGASFEEALRQAPKWLPTADRIFLTAASQTGRLPQTLANLSERHSRIAAIKSKIVFSLIYPVGILHLGALTIPLMRLIDFEKGFQWDPAQYFPLTGALLAVLWSVIALLVFLARTSHPISRKLGRSIPLIRAFSRHQAVADFALTLSVFVETGLPIQSAWLGATQIAHDPQITKAYQALKPTFDAGLDPATRLKEYAVFPSELVSYYKSGAESGKLDQSLFKVSEVFQTKANRALTLASMVYPSLCFLLVAGMIAYMVMNLYGGYLEMIYEMIDESS